MKIKVIIFTFVIMISVCIVQAQTGNNKREGMFDKEMIKDTIANYPRDTIELYLDDSTYYIYDDNTYIGKRLREDSALFDFYYMKGISKFFTSKIEYQLKDNLSDGFYCLYELTKKDAKKVNAIQKNNYLVASGQYKNHMKNGYFIFNDVGKNLINPYTKIIYFKNDTVDGYVKEWERGYLVYQGKYKMGKRDGIFFFQNNGIPIIAVHKNGKEIKRIFLDDEEFEKLFGVNEFN